jgi:hypothetical protein
VDAQPLDEMNDAALDRELQAIVGAEPSPGFVAAVRARIAGEAASRSRFTVWTVATSALGVAAIVILSVGVMRPHSAAQPAALLDARQLVPIVEIPRIGPPMRSAVGGPPRGHVVVLTRDKASSIVAPSVQSAGVRESTVRNASTDAEVLVDWREVAALRAFFDRARRGGVDLTAIVAPPTAAADINQLHDIYIAPIAFESMIGSDEKGVQQ